MTRAGRRGRAASNWPSSRCSCRKPRRANAKPQQCWQPRRPVAPWEPPLRLATDLGQPPLPAPTAAPAAQIEASRPGAAQLYLSAATTPEDAVRASSGDVGMASGQSAIDVEDAAKGATLVAVVDREEEATQRVCASVEPPPPPPPPEALPPLSTELPPCGEEVVLGLAVALERMASLAPQPEAMTSFHCVRAPRVSIRDYLGRIKKFFGCSLECYVLGLLYIDRIVKRHPHIAVSQLSSHRMLICSMTLAAKFQDDCFYTNTFYAQVGGLQVQELNRLEARMAQLLDYRLYVSTEEFEIYRSILCKAAAAAAGAAAPP